MLLLSLNAVSDAGVRTCMLLFKVNGAVWRCGLVGKARITEDGLEREEGLGNPEDSTVAAKGQGLCFCQCLGSICADSLQSRSYLPKMQAYFFA